MIHADEKENIRASFQAGVAILRDGRGMGEIYFAVFRVYKCILNCKLSKSFGHWVPSFVLKSKVPPWATSIPISPKNTVGPSQNALAR